MAQLDWKQIYSKLGKRTEWYALAVRDMFQQRIGEIVAMCEGLEIEEGKPFAFADYEIAPKVDKKLRQLYAEVYRAIRGNVVREWNYANDTTDKLIKGLFGKGCMEDNHYARFFQRNKQAMQQFLSRQTNGLDLSQRVWQYVGQARTDLEAALDLGLGQGMSADTLSRQVREYLQNPDDLFRRFRYKKGEDAEGKPIYGRKWKKRCYDKDTDSFYWVDYNPKDYHTGTGVYRSSYKNAMRLTRTETNMAYRSADITRWQQLNFVLGYEVKMSKNHPCTDICDELAGTYPKEFMFVGWHPHCYCYIVPLLCKDEELEQLTDMILRGEDADGFTPAGVVSDMPPQFTNWIAANTERIQAAQSLPYFIRDNYKGGNITKGFRWANEYKNEAGLANFSKLMGKAEIDVDELTKMQTTTAKEFAEASNYVEAGNAGGFPLSTSVTPSGVQFEELEQLTDPSELAKLLAEASKGNNLLAQYCTPEQLAELERIATQAKFAAKADGKFMVALDKQTLEAVINGDTAIFGASRYIGTNYSKVCSVALENGVVGADSGAVCILDLPKGSRYLQTMANGEPTAMLLPNSKFKVVSSEVKTVVRGGKATQVTHYHLELADDGSSFVKEVVAASAQAKAEVAAYNKAVKVAKNVLGAANKGHYDLLGIDTAALEDVVANGTASEIQAATKKLAKEMAAAKKVAVAEYAEQPTMWGLVNEFGEANATTFMANWQKHMAKTSYYSTDELFLQKVIQKELYYAKLNPTKYPTTGKFIEYFEKLEAQYKTKIALNAIQPEIDAVVVFAQTTKSAKVKNLVMELQNLTGAAHPNEAAIKSKLAEVQKEVDRLTKERLARLRKKGGGGYDIEQFYTAADKAQRDKLMFEYEKALTAASGNERDYNVIGAMQRLADFTTQLGERYASLQPTLANVDGLTEAQVQKAIKDYFSHAPINPTAPSEPYGIWSKSVGGESWFGKKVACEQLAKEIRAMGGNVSARELSLITNFTQSSNFICDYLYGASKVSLITDAAVKADVEQLLANFKAAINKAIESMPRYNGITYRGLNIYPDAIADPAKDAFWQSIMQAWGSKEKTWTMVAPTSSTTSIHTADNFADGIVHRSKGQRVIMKIYGKTGVDIHKVGYFGGGESEITFRAGSKFRLLKAPYQCKKRGLGQVGDWCIEVEEIV